MNKRYKKAFSHIVPSDSSIERIFDMTKKRKINAKPLLIAAVIASLLAGSMVSANAMTDGKVLETAKDIVEEIKQVKVFVNGEEAEPERVEFEAEEVTDYDGNKMQEYRIKYEDENGCCSYLIVGESDDGASFDSSGESIEKFEIQHKDKTVEICVPTTAVAN